MRCPAIHDPAKWPYIARCTLEAGHSGKHEDKDGDQWPNATDYLKKKITLEDFEEFASRKGIKLLPIQKLLVESWITGHTFHTAKRWGRTFVANLFAEYLDLNEPDTTTPS